MNAAVYRGKQKIIVQNVPKPTVGPNDVLLKIRSVGICGTDLHIYHGGTSVRPGTVIGHEFSGEVAAIGRSVTNVRIGDRAVAEHVVTCGKCYYCVRGKPELCIRAEVVGLDRPGALAEYLSLPANLVYAIPKSISYEEAALIEPLTIALYGASQAGFLMEKRIAVVGQGPIGLLLDQVLRRAGAHVVGVDVIPARLKFARDKGWVDETLNPNDASFSKRLKKIAGIGVDASFEVVGKEATAELCIDITRRAGNVFLLGVFEKPATLNVMQIIKKELRIIGSWTCAFSFPAAIDLVAEKKIDLKHLITHRYPLADAPRAFADAGVYADNRIKTVINI